MTVEQEVAANVVLLRVFRPMCGVLRIGNVWRQQQHRRHRRFDDKRFGRTDTATVVRLARKMPALTVCMKVVPHHPQIEVEDVPANLLSGFSHDGWGVPDKTPSIQTPGRHPVSIFSDGVNVVVPVVPVDDATGTDLSIVWDEFHVHGIGIVNRYGDERRITHRHCDLALHRRVDVAVIGEGTLGTERRFEKTVEGDGSAVEGWCSTEAGEVMEKQRDVERLVWIRLRI